MRSRTIQPVILGEERLLRQAHPRVYFGRWANPPIQSVKTNMVDCFGIERVFTPQPQAIIEIGNAMLKLLALEPSGKVGYYTCYSGINLDEHLEDDAIFNIQSALIGFRERLTRHGVTDLGGVDIMGGSAFHDAQRSRELKDLLACQGFTNILPSISVEERNRLNYASTLCGDKIPAASRMIAIAIGGNGADVCYGKGKAYDSSFHIDQGSNTIALEASFSAKSVQAAREEIRTILKSISLQRKALYWQTKAVRLKPMGESDELFCKLLGKNEPSLESPPITRNEIDRRLGLDGPDNVDQAALLGLRQGLRRLMQVESKSLGSTKPVTSPQQQEKWNNQSRFLILHFLILSELMHAFDLPAVQYGTIGGPMASKLLENMALPRADLR